MINKKSSILFLMLVLFKLSTNATVVQKTLYINRGELTTVNKTVLPYYAFNKTPYYNSQNEVIQLTTSDELILKVINTDSQIHGFHIKGQLNGNFVISPKDSIVDTVKFSTQGVFIYYDSYQMPKYSYLGAAGMIAISSSLTDKKFFWNLKEHQSSYNNLLNDNKPVNWSDYIPDYFTINSFSFLDVLDDTVSRVHGVIGDTIRIFIANTGQSDHSMHFHGFHGKIIFSSAPRKVNLIKDTFPVRRFETMIIELVADKPGFYSVHDHSLPAITAGGVYQKGMLTLMHFEE
jgi:FtsP/CotA-like multicopper oxidase with cupredoxin domain